MVEKLKLAIILVLSLGGIALLGYWALNTIEPGDIHAARRTIEDLEKKVASLEEENADLKNKLSEVEPGAAPSPDAPSPTPTPATPTPSTTTYKYQNLIDELQKLVNDKVVMKEKSRGTRVGTLQTFLNVYFNTSKKVDNDFGKTTKDDLIKFQKAVGLTGDGEAGPTTYQKMIEWLQKQG
jgi:hypothetical protein